MATPKAEIVTLSEVELRSHPDCQDIHTLGGVWIASVDADGTAWTQALRSSRGASLPSYDDLTRAAVGRLPFTIREYVAAKHAIRQYQRELAHA